MDDRVILQAARNVADPEDRRLLVEASCAGDPALLARVLEQLRRLDEAEAPGGTGASEPVATRRASDVPLPQNDEETEDLDRSLTLPAADVRGYLEPIQKPGVIGTIEHYEVIEVVGRGGFGSVLKAFDQNLHRTVAIKMLSPLLASTSPPRKRFLREARAAAAIKHEHVVQVYAVGEEPLPYLVMELVEGRTLQQHMDATGPLEVPDVLAIGRQVASGLAAAHEKGLIHRDIKPGNVLLEQGLERKVKITDFGLARAADDACITQSGAIVGTPLYMAPEQAQGSRLDHRADLFSLGSLLYAMTAGRPPFRAPTTVAILRRVIDDAPRPLSEIIPETPSWLADIIEKLMEKDPDHRFQTSAEVVELLDRCLVELQSGRPVTAARDLRRKASEHPESPPTSRGRSARHWAAVALLLVVLPVLVLLYVRSTNGIAPAPASTATANPEGPAAPPVVEAPSAPTALEPGPEANPDVLAVLGDRDYFGRLKALGAKVLFNADGHPDWVSPAIRQAMVPFGSTFELADASRLDDSPLLMKAPQVHLRFIGEEFDDEKFEELAQLLRARPDDSWPICLQLYDTSVTPATLSALEGLKFYTFDSIGLPLDADGIEALKGIYGPWALGLRRAGLDDAGLERLVEDAIFPFLTIDENRVTGAGLRALVDSQIQQLRVVRNGLSDEDLEPLSEMTGLIELVLSGNPITDAGLVHLEPLSKLAELHLSGTGVTAEGVDRLSRALPSCQIIWDGGTIEPTAVPGSADAAAVDLPPSDEMPPVAGPDPGGSDLAIRGDRDYFEAVINLGGEVLFYETPDWTSPAVRDASTIRHAPSDGLISYQIKDPSKLDNIPFLMKAPLVFLRFSGEDVDDETLRSLGRLARLRPDDSWPINLQLYFTSATSEGLAALDGVELTSLAVDGIALDPAGVEPLLGLSIQAMLGLGEAGLDDDDLERLAPGLAVGDLRLFGNHLTGRGVLSSLSGSKVIRLNLGRNDLTDVDLEPLAELTGLVSLDLSGNPITDAGLVHLESLGDLTLLQLTGTGVTAEGVDRLSRALPACRIIWNGGTVSPSTPDDPPDQQQAEDAG